MQRVSAAFGLSAAMAWLGCTPAPRHQAGGNNDLGVTTSQATTDVAPKPTPTGTTTANPCASSPGCRDDGMCSSMAGAPTVCVATAADCLAFSGCTNDGRCTALYNRCQLVSSADCARTTACRDGGACQFGDRACVKSCAESNGCKHNGLCTDDPAGCKAASSQSCKASYQCKLMGQCTAANGKCVVASNADCRVLDHCSQGNCFAFEGSCRVRDACSCDYSTGPVPPPEVQQANYERAQACLKAAGGSLPGVCPPKP